MNYETQRRIDLEIRYLKLERGIRIMMRQSKADTTALSLKIKELRSIHRQLGGRPKSKRWPL